MCLMIVISTMWRCSLVMSLIGCWFVTLSRRRGFRTGRGLLGFVNAKLQRKQFSGWKRFVCLYLWFTLSLACHLQLKKLPVYSYCSEKKLNIIDYVIFCYRLTLILIWGCCFLWSLWFLCLGKICLVTTDDVFMQDGTFLVRCSSSQSGCQPYTLVVLYHHTVYNIPVRLLEDSQFYALGKEGKKTEEVDERSISLHLVSIYSLFCTITAVWKRMIFFSYYFSKFELLILF